MTEKPSAEKPSADAKVETEREKPQAPAAADAPDDQLYGIEVATGRRVRIRRML